MKNKRFSFLRLWALIIKEFIQFKRDRSTFVIVISLPIIQLLLFGLAINTNPKHLPIALVNYDDGPFARTLVHELENTNYFNFKYSPSTYEEANHLMLTHQVLFILNIPSDFSRNLIRGNNPNALLEVDGTDPVSVNAAVAASQNLMSTVFQYDLVGLLHELKPKKPAATLITHMRYNPSAITQYNVVPGLLGVVLTMTFVTLAGMALVREREQGTLESLLSTPIRPLEVIIGKAMPFLIVGYLQVAIVLLIATFFFDVPMKGSTTLLLLVTLPFILASLFVGIMISSLAKTQLEANQMSLFFFLPSLLLSGFAFPFKGMPLWAQTLGNILPLTHYVNLIRGIMLKGIQVNDIWVDIWPILIFMFVMIFISVKRYHKTLD